MAEKSKYSKIPLSAEEQMTAENLATRVFPKDVDAEKIAIQAAALTKVWRKEKKAASKAFWKSLGVAHALSLAVRVDPIGMKRLKKRCGKVGIPFDDDTPIETLVVKSLFGCGPKLAYKYSAALRGAILLEIMPEDLGERRSPDSKVNQLTLKYLIQALLRRGDGTGDAGKGPKAPPLKWTEKAVESFATVASEASRFVCLVKQTESGSRVVGVASSLKAVQSFLKK